MFLERIFLRVLFCMHIVILNKIQVAKLKQSFYCFIWVCQYLIIRLRLRRKHKSASYIVLLHSYISFISIKMF
jgi:hypothetical protein